METWLVFVLIFAPLFLLAAFGYFYLYLFFIPKLAATHAIEDPEKVAAYRDSLLKGPAQLGAGFLAIVPVLFTVWSGITTYKQTADQNANQQFLTAAQLVIYGSSDLTKGTPSEDLKSAGAYALRKIVRANPEYCDMVTSILLSQIGENSANMPKQLPAGSVPPHVSAGISAAVLVLGSMPNCVAGRPLRLTDQYLAGAEFGGTRYFESADLRNSKLWSAYLGWADFDKAKFDGAAMSDYDALGQNDAAWQKTTSDPHWDYLKYSSVVNFEHSSLRKASFQNTSIAGASFQYADVYQANFTNTNLSRADFSNAQNVDTIVLTDACFFPGEAPTGLSQDQLRQIAARRSSCWAN